jgi:hypothetical protein
MEIMDATSAAILGTSIGAAAAIASAGLTNFVTTRNERLRQRDVRRATDINALRKETATVFSEIFAIQHAMNWVTWFARHSPSEIDVELVKRYDAEVHAAYPRLLGALATVAALNLLVHTELRRIFKRVYALEEKIAIALRRPNGEDGIAYHQLAMHLGATQDLEEDLPLELARVMQIAELRLS